MSLAILSNLGTVSILPVIRYHEDVYGKGLAKRLTQMGFPATLSEKGDGMLLCLADAVGIRYRNKIPVKAGWIAEIAAHDLDELNHVLFFLQELDFAKAESGGAERHWGLTARGWKRIDELKRRGVSTDSAFVAMWFDESLHSAYSEGIAKLEEDTGFTMLRIDMREFNDKICDKIIAEIKKSRFLIADVTGQRHAVYFEAGFAKGFGLPVIWTCREDQKDEVKNDFDTRQYSYIFWTEANELREKLRDRILATIGKAS